MNGNTLNETPIIYRSHYIRENCEDGLYYDRSKYGKDTTPAKPGKLSGQEDVTVSNVKKKVCGPEFCSIDLEILETTSYIF